MGLGNGVLALFGNGGELLNGSDVCPSWRCGAGRLSGGCWCFVVHGVDV